jgi:predicted RNase H-like nuclease (RuvC/YqgF family)
MPLAKEDMDLVKAQVEAWLLEMLPEQKPGVYDLELRTRMLKVEEELRHQRELMQQGFAMMNKRFESMQHNMDKRFDQVDKRFEQMDKRFEQMERRFEQMDKRFDVLTLRIDRFMRWSFGLTLTVAGIIIAVLKFT